MSEAVFGSLMRLVLYPIGLVIFLYQFFCNKQLTKLDRFLPLGIVCWFPLASVLRAGTLQMDMLMTTFVMLLFWCVAFWYGCGMAREVLPKHTRILLHGICGASAVLCIIGFLNFAGYGWFDGTMLEAVGFTRFNRFGLLDSSNTDGVLMALCLLCTVYLFIHTKGALKILPLAEAVLFLICLAMTDSKTSRIIFAIGMGLVAFHFIWNRFKEKRLRLLAAIAALLACAVLFHSLVLVTGRGIVQLQQRKRTDQVAVHSQVIPDETASQAGTEDAAAPDAEQMQLSVRSADESSTISSRTILWKSWLGLLKTEPVAWLYGTNSVPKNMPEEGYGAHNSYISTLVCHGLPTFILILVFLFRLLKAGIPVGLKGTSGTFVFPIMLLMCLIDACMESMFFYSVKYPNFLFMVMAGLTLGYDRMQKAE